MEFLDRLFDASGFAPHGYCLLWEPELIWLHAVSDTLIGIAYYSIPVALVYFVWKRRDLAYRWVFWLFAGFILACGTTHFFDVWTLWHPDYGVQGLLKAATACASLLTAALLWPLLPHALALPSAAQLRLANDQLEQQIRARDEATARERETEERYRFLVENVTEYAIFMLDPNGVVTSWNAGAERIKGYKADEIVGRNFECFYTPEDRARGAPREALEIAAREGKYESERPRVRMDGSCFWGNIVIQSVRDRDGHLLGFTKITRDVTERRVAQDELERTRTALAQSQKMEAIGQLAGGIAHDLNNFLTTVIGNIELFLRRADIRETAHRSLLVAAMRGAEGSAALVSKLLAFSRKQVLAPVVTDLNKLVVGSSTLLQSASGETIKMEVVLAGGLWRTLIDPDLMETALLNLVINARDAMPNGGRLTVETANAFLDDDYARTHDIAPGQYVMVAVSDTGGGMDERMIERAFEPYYTTKPAGSGSGLGLSQVYGFVKQSGGHIKLYSEPGRGTTAKIYLPRDMADAQAARGPQPVQGSPRGGHELILVVEDNEAVRSFTSDALTQLGYSVLEADSAEAALRIIEQRHDLSLLLTDVVLPDMNGRLLAVEAQRRRPGLKLLFTSGYTQNAIVHHGRLDPNVHFISKPFKIDALGRKIRDVIDRP